MNAAQLDDAQKILDAYAAELGLAAIKLDDRLCATLEVEEIDLTISVTFEPFGMLWLHLDLGQIVGDGDEAPEFLLKLGLCAWASNKLTIGLGEDGSRVVGFTGIPLAVLDLELLKKMVVAALETAFAVHKQLPQQAYSIDPQETGAPQDPDSQTIIIRG